MFSRAKDITGQKFGKLTALKMVGKDARKHVLWLCRCDCGNEIIKNSGELISGKIKSCGCSKLERFDIYKQYSKKLIKCYHSIKERCYNPNSKSYQNYGQLGIKMCKEWHDDIFIFLEWSMKNGYEDGLTIERIDVNKDYCPENCKYIPKSQQAENRTMTHWVEYNGEIHSLSYWSGVLNISRPTLRKYLKLGYSLDKVKNIVKNGKVVDIEKNKKGDYYD